MRNAQTRGPLMGGQTESAQVDTSVTGILAEAGIRPNFAVETLLDWLTKRSEGQT